MSQDNTPPYDPSGIHGDYGHHSIPTENADINSTAPLDAQQSYVAPVQPYATEPTPEQATDTEPAPEPFKYVPVFSEPNIESKYVTLPVNSKFIELAELDSLLNALRETVKAEGNTAEGRKLLEEVNINFSGLATGMYNGDDFASTLKGNMAQSVPGDKGVNLRMSYPKFKADPDIEVLEGKPAMRYLSRMTGVGNPTKVVLWNSGLTIILDSFRERKLIDLSLAFARNRIRLGNATRGASFTGDDVYVTSTILDFIIPHIIDCSMKGWTSDKLRKRILVTDIPALLAGALAAIYPGGYPILHPCINVANGTCSYTTTIKRKDNHDYEPDGMLDFTKVLWVDRDRLSSKNRSHLSVANNTATVAAINEYQHEVGDVENRGLIDIWSDTEVGSKVQVQFKVPNLAEYTKVCGAWVERVVEMTDAAMALESDLGAKESAKQRNVLMLKYSGSLDLLKQCNWIDYIMVTDPDGSCRTINSSDDIRDALEIFGDIDNFSTKFTKAVQVFKEKSCIAFTGLPNFECPQCGHGQVDPTSPHPTLIPINLTGYFFTIMDWMDLIRDQQL